MQRKAIVAMIAALVGVVVFAAWFDISGRNGDAAAPTPTPASTSTPTAQPTDAPTPEVEQSLVERNRTERRGPSWSPADVTGEDGQPIELGDAVPGAFEPIRVGMSIQQAIGTGLMERDPQRERACEGTFWKWKGQWSEGLDVIVGQDKQIASLGMSKGGLETPEGISIGNSFAALTKTYGDRLQGPERMDYGQAGAFLRDGDNWIGFGFDNQPGQLTDASRIAFIEVSNGNRPGLLRDGC